MATRVCAYIVNGYFVNCRQTLMKSLCFVNGKQGSFWGWAQTMRGGVTNWLRPYTEWSWQNGGATFSLQWRHNERDSVSNHVSIVCSTFCSGVDQRKHQSSASLAFVRGIHRWPVDSPHKGPLTRQMFPFHDVIMSSEIKPIWETLLTPRWEKWH